jgi:lysyl-tRNA synthetase class I
VFLGQDKGPRAGYFLSNLNKDFVLKRLQEAIK